MAEARYKAAAVGIVLVLLVSLVGAGLAYKQVPEGHEGVTTEWGAVTGETLSPGAHWKIPVMQGVQDVEVRPRTYTMSQTRGEGDQASADAVEVKTVNGSTVAVDITVRYHIVPDESDVFVAEWNNEQQMEERLIRPTIRSVLRDEASSLQTTGEGSIYTQGGRQALEQTAIKALRAEFDGQPIELEAVQIRNIDLPEEIDRTLDQKEQAKQQVEVEREEVKQERQRAEQRRVQAQAEADVIATRGEALRENPVVLDARLIEAYDNGTVFVTGQSGQQVILDASDAAQNGNQSTSESGSLSGP
jgi:regulator of protease activity HflC (stomatin/prohibitin superfamily)